MNLIPPLLGCLAYLEGAFLALGLTMSHPSNDHISDKLKDPLTDPEIIGGED